MTDEVDWRSAVTVTEDVDLARELSRRLPPPGTLRPISVTDLVSPRRAYWRAVKPVPFDATRRDRLDRGRAVHRRLGIALAEEGALEVRVRGEGAVGRIDLLSDVPVEVKTSGSPVEADALLDARPEYVEQLAMYCALADRPAGRLLTIDTTEGSRDRIRAADITLRDHRGLREDIRHRVEALRRAWSEGRPGDLPGCRWFGRGCEFQDAGACDCAPSEATADGGLAAAISVVRDREDVATRVAERLREIPAPAEPPLVSKFREIVYPRRTYFDRTRPTPAADFPRAGPQEPLDLYGRVVGALEAGPLGEMTRLPARADEPDEEVIGFRGTPLILRTSRGRDPATGNGLLEYQPQYALELGFRAVATGHPSAYLVLGRERATPGIEPIQVFRFQFAPASTFSRLWRTRRSALSAALLARAPAELSACADWMFAGCPYRSECACGATGTRSQR
jgi:hypothetical protein